MAELKPILSALTKYRDIWGLITQPDMDGGDTSQRTGSEYALLASLQAEQDDRGKDIRAGFLYDLDKLRVAEGRYVRHPTAQITIRGRYIPWYANPNNFPRDQSVVIQAAMVLLNTKEELRALVKARAKHWFFHFNTESYDDSEDINHTYPDIPAPIEFAQFIRGLDLWYLRPLLYILDLQLLSDLFFRSLNDRNKWDSDNMLVPVMLSSLSKWPTCVGKLAKWLYARTDAVTRLQYYHSDMNNGIEPLGDLYVLAFNRLIK